VDCDSEVGDCSFDGYTCVTCRKNSLDWNGPLTGHDAILHSENANTFLSSALESDDEEMEMVQIHSTSIIKRSIRQRSIFGAASGHSSPVAGSSAINAHHYSSSSGPLGSLIDDELFTTSQCGGTAMDLLRDLSGISSPAATGTTEASSSSARDSPLLTTTDAAMSDNDEYRPPTYTFFQLSF